MSDLSGSDLSVGLQMLQSGQLAAAAEYFSNIVQRDSSNGPAYGYLGIALTKLGQTDQALQALGQASQLQPQEPGAQYNVAIGLMHAGRQQDAIPFLEYTLSLDPNHSQAQAALASINASPSPAPTAQQPTAANPYSSSNPASSPLSGPVYPASAPQGMHYTQTARPQVVRVAPDLGTRLMRGIGWGAIYGNVWTAWMLFWELVWNFNHATVTGIIGLLVIFIAIFTVGGIVAGLVIAALKPSLTTGIAVGVVIGIGFCGLQIMFSGGAQMLVNIFFWFFTGRFIGANIASRVHRPIQQ